MLQLGAHTLARHGRAELQINVRADSQSLRINYPRAHLPMPALREACPTFFSSPYPQFFQRFPNSYRDYSVIHCSHHSLFLYTYIDIYENGQFCYQDSMLNLGKVLVNSLGGQ